MTQWSEEISYRGERYTIVYTQRPFREGLEIELRLPSGPLKVAELGLGKAALEAKIHAVIDNYLKTISK